MYKVWTIWGGDKSSQGGSGDDGLRFIIIITTYRLVTTDRWTDEQREFVIKAYYQNGKCHFQTRRVFRLHFKISCHQALPSDNAIRIKLYQEIKKNSRISEDIERVRQAVQKSPHRSAIRHIARLAMSNRDRRENRLNIDLNFLWNL